jgi:hypothetical protein
VRNLEDYRGPNVGTRSSGWKQALQAFTIYFDGRIACRGERWWLTVWPWVAPRRDRWLRPGGSRDSTRYVGTGSLDHEPSCAVASHGAVIVNYPVVRVRGSVPWGRPVDLVAEFAAVVLRAWVPELGCLPCVVRPATGVIVRSAGYAPNPGDMQGSSDSVGGSVGWSGI